MNLYSTVSDFEFNSAAQDPEKDLPSMTRKKVFIRVPAAGISIREPGSMDAQLTLAVSGPELRLAQRSSA